MTNDDIIHRLCRTHHGECRCIGCEAAAEIIRLRERDAKLMFRIGGLEAEVRNLRDQAAGAMRSPPQNHYWHSKTPTERDE
jgi:hypothetical protein